GTMEAFVIDPAGRLRHARRDADKNWGSWSTLGEGFESCAAAGPDPDPEPEPVPDADTDGETDAALDLPAESDAVEDAPAVEDAVGDAAIEDGAGEDDEDAHIGVAGACSCGIVA
ncbi:MAG: hypothetical protein ABIJ56_04705, partial [Pseudomonadota bacterium]